MNNDIRIRVDIANDKYSLYSYDYGLYFFEDLTFDEFKIALAKDLEYHGKLKTIELITTFPDGFKDENNEIIHNPEGKATFYAWHQEMASKITNIKIYQDEIDKKINEMAAYLFLAH